MLLIVFTTLQVMTYKIHPLIILYSIFNEKASPYVNINMYMYMMLYYNIILHDVQAMISIYTKRKPLEKLGIDTIKSKMPIRHFDFHCCRKHPSIIVVGINVRRL